MSTFGTLFRVTTFGESHCASVGAIIDGCPPVRSTIHTRKILNSRSGPGIVCKGHSSPAESETSRSIRSHNTGESSTHRSSTRIEPLQRNEKDLVQLQSGLEQGVTLGTPIALLVKNEDQRPHDYSETDLYPRPSHADFTYLEKYGLKASSGGGRSSARETIGLLIITRLKLNDSSWLRSSCRWGNR
jgi:chorismate synthase